MRAPRRSPFLWLALLLAAAVPAPLPAQGHDPSHHPAPGGDSAAFAKTAHRYAAVLSAADSAAALALLAPDAVILESGGVESRAEYRSHHLPADIEFARAVRSEQGPIRVRVQGDAAWATSTSTTQGEFRGRAINSAGAELMVLMRTQQGWRITAIHWSSRTRRPSPGGA